MSSSNPYQQLSDDEKNARERHHGHISELMRRPQPIPLPNVSSSDTPFAMLSQHVPEIVVSVKISLTAIFDGSFEDPLYCTDRHEKIVQSVFFGVLLFVGVISGRFKQNRACSLTLVSFFLRFAILLVFLLAADTAPISCWLSSLGNKVTLYDEEKQPQSVVTPDKEDLAAMRASQGGAILVAMCVVYILLVFEQDAQGTIFCTASAH